MKQVMKGWDSMHRVRTPKTNDPRVIKVLHYTAKGLGFMDLDRNYTIKEIKSDLISQMIFISFIFKKRLYFK
jgi:hypothetical protein